MFVDVRVFSLYYFIIISVWRKALALHFNTFLIHLTLYLRMLSLVQRGPVVLEKKILKYCLLNFPIPILSPFEKECYSLFEQTLIT